MVMNENSVASMGLYFLCNSIVEELYYMKENKSVSEKLKNNCQKTIAELNSLKWPCIQPTPKDIRIDLFNTNLNIQTFEQICEHYQKSAEQMIEGLIQDLTLIISDKPVDKKYQTSERLQEFFDVFEDYSFYATRDCLRGDYLERGYLRAI